MPIFHGGLDDEERYPPGQRPKDNPNHKNYAYRKSESKQMKHWYNCWLFHNWDKWLPATIMFYPTVYSEPRQMVGQVRYCKICNKQRSRLST